MSIGRSVETLDTNIAVYAMTDSPKTSVAAQIVARVDFLSVQVLNEYANLSVRKYGRAWSRVSEELQNLSEVVNFIATIELAHHRDAVRLAARYGLSFYDALLVAVALANGACVLYTEDMQHELVIDGVLTIVNPFLTATAP